MISENLQVTRPDYEGGSIVNLMASIIKVLNPNSKADEVYPQLDIFPDDKLKDTKRIGLIVVDGLGQHLYSILRNQHSLENWALGSMTSVFPPTTASAITTFLTGTAPLQHGLTGWYMLLKELGTVATILPFVSRHGQYALECTGLQPLDLIQCPTLVQTLQRNSGFLQPSEIYDSTFSRSLTQQSFRKGYRGLDQFQSFLENFILDRSGLDYLYSYIPNIDTLAHKFGPYSSEVAQEYSKIGKMISDLCSLAESTGTLLLITADHGFIHNPPDKRISLLDHPDLKDTLTLPLCGEPRTAYAYLKTNRINDFLSYIESHLDDVIDLKTPSEMMSENWFGMGTAHPHMEDRIGDYVLCMRENYTIYDALMTEKIPSLMGAHGGTSHAEQIVPLFSAGP